MVMLDPMLVSAMEGRLKSWGGVQFFNAFLAPCKLLKPAHAILSRDRELCIHVGECGRVDNELFVGGREPWCDPDQVSPAESVAVCGRYL
ncbi:MAG: (4Fe-4S)-binding protein [Myxococcota bacterium]